MGTEDRPGGTGGDGASPFAISALTDAFRRERAGMQGQTPTTAKDLTPEEAHDAAMAHAIGCGAVDPTSVLGSNEVENVTGDRIDDSVIGFASAFVSVAFAGERGRYRVGSIHGGERSRSWRPAKKWDRLIRGYVDAVPVEGLGDQAFRTGGFTVVRSGPVVLFAEVTRDDLGAGEAAALADELLRLALSNLTASS